MSASDPGITERNNIHIYQKAAHEIKRCNKLDQWELLLQSNFLDQFTLNTGCHSFVPCNHHEGCCWLSLGGARSSSSFYHLDRHLVRDPYQIGMHCRARSNTIVPGFWPGVDRSWVEGASKAHGFHGFLRIDFCFREIII